MRFHWTVLTMVAALALAAPTRANPTPEPKTVPNEEPYHDSCFGDRYESDADLNEGNEISDQEIQQLIDQMNGPGV